MIRIERISGAEAQALLEQDKRLWAAIGGKDGAQFPEREDHFYLKCIGPHKQTLGCWIFHPVNDDHPAVYEMHANYLSKYWGKKHHMLTTEAAKAAFAYMYAETNAELLCATIPHSSPQVQRFAVRVGAQLVSRDANNEYYVKTRT